MWFWVSEQKFSHCDISSTVLVTCLLSWLSSLTSLTSSGSWLLQKVAFSLWICSEMCRLFILLKLLDLFWLIMFCYFSSRICSSLCWICFWFLKILNFSSFNFKIVWVRLLSFIWLVSFRISFIWFTAKTVFGSSALDRPVYLVSITVE